MKNIKNRIPILLILFLMIFVFSFGIQAQVLDKNAAANPGGKQVLDYFAGSGVMCAGDLWESFMPANRSTFYSEAATIPTQGSKTLFRVGNFDRSWSTPGGNYPMAFTHSYWWGKMILAMVYDPSSTFCPKTVGGATNTAFFADPDDAAKTYSNYAYLHYKNTLKGAGDPARDYVTETRWVDATKRHHAVYDAGFPTNVGLDVRMRAHQFSGPNWNNLNDYIIVEISFKNTGEVDINMDGTPEQTNHKIVGLSLDLSGEASPSVSNDLCGRRCASEWSTTPARMSGYIGDDDAAGSPWAFVTGFMGTSAQPPAAGFYDMGMNSYARRWYTDIWSGFTFIGAKKGGIPTDISKGTGKNEDKTLLWGTPAIGTGSQRGWFLSASTGQGLGLTSITNPKYMFLNSCGTYYKNGGKDNDKTKLDYLPNPKFFASGDKEKIETWVPKEKDATKITEAFRPNGDTKLLSLESGNSALYTTNWEDGTGYPAGFGKWTKGYSKFHNYDGDIMIGSGPYSLDVGEEMTLTFVYLGGFRLEGIQKSLRAARFAYESNYAVPEPPPVPEMVVKNTLNNSVHIHWDKRAENDSKFAGYKIWKSSQFIKYSWLTDGMRLIDKYQEQMTVGESKEAYKKPINPKFDAFVDVSKSTTKGQYAGYTYGTWELTKVIPKAELANYAKAGSTSPATGYNYIWEDKLVVSGFSYWYYVSAYGEGTYTGPAGETTTRIETHSVNRNGASGLWTITYPYGTAHPLYSMTDQTFLKNIGAVQVVYSALATYSDLNTNVAQVTVKPNPYKRAALHDNFTNVYDHKILFSNLPPKATITITDVAGKVIDIINFESTDPNKGATFWDMFSKDGMEVASGLYLYYVTWTGGSAKGKFAIIK